MKIWKHNDGRSLLTVWSRSRNTNDFYEAKFIHKYVYFSFFFLKGPSRQQSDDDSAPRFCRSEGVANSVSITLDARGRCFFDKHTYLPLIALLNLSIAFRSICLCRRRSMD